MTLTRFHALAIAVGLVLIGVAVARAGTEGSSPSPPGLEESRTFAEGYMLRDGRPTGEWRPGAPQELDRDFPAAL
jgi:hypothetical protein